MAILQVLLGIIVVAGAFGFIIFIHELGHFAVARAVGIRCPQFAIGIGPALFSFKWRGTLFALRLFPIGGYVMMVGEDPSLDAEDSWHERVATVLGDATFPTTPGALLERLRTAPPSPDRDEVIEHLETLKPEQLYANQEALEGNFNYKTIPQRMAVILGGVTMNFIAATLIFWTLGFTMGLGDIDRDSKPFVTEITKGSPAEKAGLKEGDNIVQVGDTKIESGGELIRTVGQYPGQQVKVVAQRGGKLHEFEITPDIWIYGTTFAVNGSQVSVRTSYDPRQGWSVGDVVTSLNGAPVNDASSLLAAVKPLLDSANPGEEKLVKVSWGRKDKGPLEYEAHPTELRPLGKLGVTPAQVMSLGFHRNFTPRIVGVTAGSPAALAGFQPGDVLAMVNDASIFDPSELDRELQKHPVGVDGLGRFLVERGGAAKRLNIQGPLPASASALGLQFEPVTTAMILRAPFRWISAFTLMPVKIISKLSKGETSATEIRKGSQGPLGMMQMIYQVSSHGWAMIFFFLGILNSAVGAFNLIPFPALDGSRFLLLAITGLRGKEMDAMREAQFHFVGLVILLSLVLVITLQDVQRIFVGTPLVK